MEIMFDMPKQKTVTFPRETVVDLWDWPQFDDSLYIDEDGNRVRWIDEQIVEQRRWVTVFEATVEINGKTYTVVFERGSTEYQECAPWEYNKTVTFYEVEPKEVTVVQYVPVYEDEDETTSTND